MFAGPLTAVQDLGVTKLQFNAFSISWLPPFSLNLTNAEPDVVYCVEIYNVTDELNREHLVSNCSVLNTEYNFTTDHEAPTEQYYEITVTPRSNVEGARNGSAARVIFGVLTGIYTAIYNST